MANPQYVSATTYNAALTQLNTLTSEITADQTTISQQAAQISTLQSQISALQSQTPTVVSSQLVYVKNCFSCLYLYNQVDTYSDGTHKTTPVVKRRGACAGLPVTYVGLVYKANTNGGQTYVYNLYAKNAQGLNKFIGTYEHAGPVSSFTCTV